MLHTPNKRRRIDMLLSLAPPPTAITPTVAPSSDGQRSKEVEPHEELRRFALEVEPVVIRTTTTSSSTSSKASTNQEGCTQMMIGYRPTYKAVLAKRGYLVKNTLGYGSYSKVKKALCFSKHCVVGLAAVKIIDRQKAPQDYQEKFLPRELKHWPRLQHQNLIRLKEWFQDNQRVFMVLEYAEGGDALKYIQATGAIAEERARVWTSQIASAVRYMHDLDIAHRDLKLENLLIDSSDNIKLCDFGFVREATPTDLSRTYCGSKSYAAPEILQGRPYDPKKADVWAIGVILYIFVTGKMPFDETKGTKIILEEQRLLDFHWSRARNRLSAACQNLIRRMFTWDFATRPAVHAVLVDFWFLAPEFPGTQRDVTTRQPELCFSSLKQVVPLDPASSLTNKAPLTIHKPIKTNSPASVTLELDGALRHQTLQIP